MKKIMFVFAMIIIVIISSCSPKTEDPAISDPAHELTPSNPTPAEETENVEIEYPKIKIDARETIYFSNQSNDIAYNPLDDSIYISQYGQTAAELLYQSFDKDFYPFDPPEIEKFSKINLSSGETGLINNSWVENIFYSEDYIYFIDPYDNDTLKRVKDGIVEVLYPLSELDENYAKDIFIENGVHYMMTKDYGVKAFDLVSKKVIEDRCFDIEDNFGFQIQDGFIISFSKSGLVWKEGSKEPEGDYAAFRIINDYYIEKHGDDRSFGISNFVYFDDYLVVQADGYSGFKGDLLLIDLRSHTIEVIAEDLEYSLKGFAVNDNIVYYIIKDSLNSYNPETKESSMIISLHEGSESDEYFDAEDYGGYENIKDVVFINGKCYLYLQSMISYSFSRLAELDLITNEILYLTDFYKPKINTITTFYGYPVSFEYPNDYSVFIDGGSAGGTIINNPEKKLSIQISGMAMYYINIEDAYKTKTAQGFSLYYAYNFTTGGGRTTNLPFGAVIYDGEKLMANINMYHGSGVDLKEYEEEILAILKSMYFYDETIVE